jgi:signal peptidase I
MPSSAAAIPHSGTTGLKPVASEEGVLDTPSPAHPLRPSPAGKLKSTLWVIVPGLALALAALMLIPAALGYHRYVITGDSMSGSIERGSIVFDDEVPVADLREGDVITYDPPQGSGVTGPVTHRIDTIKENRRGETRFRTKGDNNATADPWTFTLDQPTQARVAFDIPYVGYAFAALSVRWVRILLIGLPALLIAFVLVRRMWREAGEELERRKQAGADDSPAPVAAPAPAPAAAVAAPAPVALPAAAAAPVAAAEHVATPEPVVPAEPAPAAGLPADALAPSPNLLDDLRRDVERLRESSGMMIEGLVRLRGRLEGVELA